ncbi:MAG: C1 family peptidase [Sedimentisphaerales bacterium]|nr:C1 family peptidase [Sedimentisphaerales bacterium]
MNTFNTMKFSLAAMIVLTTTGCAALADNGQLDTAAINELRSSFTMDPHTRAMYNAITNGDIKKMALNRDVLNQHEDLFSNRIKTKGITNQKSSGRCWMFAALNILRPKVIKKYDLEKFEFSQNYLLFWDKIEKANRFLEYMIEFRDRDLRDREVDFLLTDPIGDGGYWISAVELIKKYGLVPKDIMPETNSSSGTSMMNKLIILKLRSHAAQIRKLTQQGKSVEQLRVEKKKMLTEIYRILAMNLGEPPTEFQWRYESDKKKSEVSADQDEDDDHDENNVDEDDDDDDKDVNEDNDDDDGNDADDDDDEDTDDDSTENTKLTELKTYTPQSFYCEFVDVDLENYINLLNDPSRPYGKHYLIKLTENIRNSRSVTYANINMAELKQIAAQVIIDNEPVWFGCDVGPDQSSDKGIMALGLYDYGSIYNLDFTLSKADRSLYRSSVRNHAMVFVGVDIQNEKPVKWLVENSWGSDRGDSGYWTMYDDWFDLHMFNIVVPKKYVSQEILNIFDQDPVILPVWDPLW